MPESRFPGWRPERVRSVGDDGNFSQLLDEVVSGRSHDGVLTDIAGKLSLPIVAA